MVGHAHPPFSHSYAIVPPRVRVFDEHAPHSFHVTLQSTAHVTFSAAGQAAPPFKAGRVTFAIRTLRPLAASHPVQAAHVYSQSTAHAR